MLSKASESRLSLLRRIVAADPWRRSRLHDMRGNFAGSPAVLTDLPKALLGAVGREVFGRYPVQPWIPYPAIKALAEIGSPDWQVLEHGSGMSTLWWAARVASVHAIEASERWYQHLQKEIQARRLKNVTLEWKDGAAYTDLTHLPSHAYDLMVIDGHGRDEVAPEALRLIKRPGWVYLDNTDFGAQWHENYGAAEELLLAEAKRHGAEVTYFTGFAPATAVASQGLLLSFR